MSKRAADVDNDDDRSTKQDCNIAAVTPATCAPPCYSAPLLSNAVLNRISCASSSSPHSVYTHTPPSNCIPQLQISLQNQNQLQLFQQHQIQLQIQKLHQQHQYADVQHQLFDQPSTQACNGITLSRVQARMSNNDRKIVEKGFHLLVGNAFRHQALIRGQSGNWPHGPHVKGLLFHDKTNPSWMCVEINGTIGFRKSGKCSGITPHGTTHCTQCQIISHNFIRACRNEVKAINNELGTAGTFQSLMYRDPSIFANRMRSHSREIHYMKKKEIRNRAIIERLRTKEVKIPNINDDIVLGDEKAFRKQYNKMMSQEKDVDKKEVFDLLFQEMCVVRQRKKKLGTKHGHIWTPLMIQYSGFVRNGNGGGGGLNANNFDFLSEACNMPKNQTIMRYSHTDTSSPDGPMMETILQNATMLDELAPDLEHAMRYGKISLDSHKIKDRFGAFLVIPFY